MFGLMKARACHLSGDQKLRRRLHYCGACKTIGRMYGQRSRLFLNNDTVFLGELLSAAQGLSDSVYNWAQAYQSYNCLSMPGSQDEMPLALQIAATATVVLTEFKLKDHLEDSSSFLVKAAARVYSKSFSDATAVLKSWDFPVERLRTMLESQSTREANVAKDHAAAGGRIEYLSEPTAAASGLFFEHGMKMVGRDDLSAAAYRIGHGFGALIYLLDAFEDYERDYKHREFNAIRETWRFSDPRLNNDARERLKQILLRMAGQTCDEISALGLAQDWTDIFVSQLRSNLASRLAVRLPIVQGQIAGQMCRPVTLVRQRGPVARLKEAISIGKTMLAGYRQSRASSTLDALATPVVFLSAVLVAMLFPEQARGANSYRQCIGVAFNLMFLTALLRSILRAPLQWAHVHQSVPPQNVPPGAGPPDEPFGPVPHPGPLPEPPPGPLPGKRKSGGCSFCCIDCDCCDACDCCEGCECCCDCGECAGCCDC